MTAELPFREFALLFDIASHSIKEGPNIRKEIDGAATPDAQPFPVFY
jgi:hypothetical protein